MNSIFVYYYDFQKLREEKGEEENKFSSNIRNKILSSSADLIYQNSNWLNT